MYELPGSGVAATGTGGSGSSGAGSTAEQPPMLVDLVDDDDLANMWEEVDEAQVRSTPAALKASVVVLRPRPFAVRGRPLWRGAYRSASSPPGGHQ